MNKKTKLIIAVFCLISLTLHLVADAHSGFASDELLHIATGNHLAFGYMEFPPLIGVLAFIQNLFDSQSVFIHHIFTHLAGVLIMVYAGKTTVELGGKCIAVFIVLFCLLISPGITGSQQVFEPVVFSQMFWILCFFQLIRFIKYEKRKDLWLLTIFICLFFLTKYDALFFLLGLLLLVFFKRVRRALIKNRFWQCLIAGGVLLLPNIIWQWLHGFPALMMFHRLYETQLNDLNALNILRQLFIDINPIVFLLMLPGLFFMFSGKENRRVYRPLAVSVAGSVFFLFYCKGKAYYFFPVIISLLPFCGIFWERIIEKGKSWLLYPLTLILLIGSVLIPFGMPVYSFRHYLGSAYKYYSKEVKNGKRLMLLQQYVTGENWKKTMSALKSVYDSLPGEQTEDCLIWAKHYSQAGAVDLLGKQYGLPPCFSYHGSYYNWAPHGKMPETVIAFCYNDADINFFRPFFKEVVAVKKLNWDYASGEGWVNETIFICKAPKQNFDELSSLFKNRIFE